MTHLGPDDACWLWACTACSDDPGGSEDVVNCEVVVLQKSLRDVNNLDRVETDSQVTAGLPRRNRASPIDTSNGRHEEEQVFLPTPNSWSSWQGHR